MSGKFTTVQQGTWLVPPRTGSRFVPGLLFALILLPLSVAVTAQTLDVKTTYRAGDFKLVFGKGTATIVTDPNDLRVVQIAADDLAADIDRVTGKEPARTTDMGSVLGQVVIVGTLGKCRYVDDLAKTGKVDVSEIRNKWESYVLATVKDPFPGLDSALVIAGSDRRGTAFGVFELSEMIGVSPWYWWADITPEHKDNLLISKGTRRGGEPSVKYRGIFLNDEDWGLEPWAAKTFEPETGNIGPKVYAKIFELLLRLKANTLWPAMHEVTTPFNAIPANCQLADDYAIVMGSSHAEPMLRNNVGEWKANKDDYNFVTNAAGVTDYWKERVKENARYENIYTLGMRGIHDSPIQGTRSQAERIPLLEKIFAVQRSLLSEYVSPDIRAAPQIFCPYKEVLSDYRAGLKVPDDVTIVFPDDNFGYIRQFPTHEQQQRSGGFGVYYHISYLGRPLSYTWLNSSPPALIWEEMSKAYANGIRKFWMLNVGDIKPAEIGVELFLQMAWDAKKWNVSNIDGFLTDWAALEFGNADSKEIGVLMDEYFRLGFQRKPEQLQWYIPGETPRASDLTENEIRQRLDAYDKLRMQAEAVYKEISPSKKDAFYELVLYPLRSAAFANQRFFGAELANRYLKTDPVKAKAWAIRAREADSQIGADARYFNNDLAGAKWRFIMSPEMNSGQWMSMRSTPPDLTFSELDKVEPEKLPANKSFGKPTSRRPVRSFNEVNNVISIEAEHFQSSNDRDGFGWRVIRGLGKTGDSVSVFPSSARIFSDRDAPTIEYKLNVVRSAQFVANFYLLPTQPLATGTGLSIGYSIDGGPPQIIVVDNDTEVGGQKWSYNILNESTVGSSGKIDLSAGAHILKVFAVGSGAVLDKITLNSGPVPESYFGPAETAVY